MDVGRKKYDETYIKTCKECGEKFDIYGFQSWAWRTKNNYFCSYHCALLNDKKSQKNNENLDYEY